MAEAPSLPAYPGTVRYAAMLSSLRAAGHEHLLSFLRPVLPGEIRLLDCLWVRAAAYWWHPVGPAHLRTLRRHVRDSYRGARREPAEAVLSVLDGAVAAGPTALWRLVLYQVSRYLFARLSTDLRPDDTEQALRALGVVAEEATLLAFAVLERFPPRHDEVVLKVAAAVEARALVEAARLAAQLPRIPPPDAAFAAVLADLRAGRAELRRLLAEGTQREAGGDVESATRAYLRAVRSAPMRTRRQTGCGAARRRRRRSFAPRSRQIRLC